MSDEEKRIQAMHELSEIVAAAWAEGFRMGARIGQLIREADHEACKQYIETKRALTKEIL